MPTVSLSAPPPPFACGVCESHPWSAKAGPGCTDCPLFKGHHYVPHGVGPDNADVLIVAGASKLASLKFGEAAVYTAGQYHAAGEDDGAKILLSAVSEVFKGMTSRLVYSVKCVTDNVPRKAITACQGNLKNEVLRVVGARRSANKTRPLVIIACGTAALTALGVPGVADAKAQGRVYDIEFAGVRVKVLCTQSLREIAAATGKYRALVTDLERARDLVLQVAVTRAPQEEIEKHYRYPKTLEEVKELIDYVIGYSEDNVDPMKWSIAVDTETNTLHPNWDGLRCTVVSISWSAGHAAGIALWHKETPYDPEAAWKEVLRLLLSGKPTVWHNAKFDLKVLWKTGLPYGHSAGLRWDTMLGEHALEEDKSGQYGLKHLTARFLPRYSGYEDQLHALLEGASKAHVDKAKKKAPKTPKLSAVVERAYNLLVEKRIVKSTKFQPRTLEKHLASQHPSELHTALKIVLAAKKNKDFVAVAEKKEVEVKLEGGFETVPLRELLFYAAVDTDATRQMAVIQIKRMAKEEIDYEALRQSVSSSQRYNTNPKTKGFKVPRICTDPAPLRTLMASTYVPVTEALAKIEYGGTHIDQVYLVKGKGLLQVTVDSVQNQIQELCGDKVNVNSGQQVARFLFSSGVGYKHPVPAMAEKLARENPNDVFYSGGRIRYQAHHYTGGGAEQTSEAALKRLVTTYKDPLANLLLTYKKAEKGLHSFFENIGTLSSLFGDNRIHPGYNIHGTGTGRLSSSSGVKGVGFNNQNVPKGNIGALRDYEGNLVLDKNGKPVFEGVKCKSLFIPDDPSMVFCNADAKGAEVAVFSAYARDEGLISALIDGLDAHCFFSSKALNPDLVGRDASGKKLTGEARRIALGNAKIDDDHAWTYEDFKARDDILKKGYGGGNPKDPSTWYSADLVDYGKRLDALRDNIKRLVFGMLYGAGIRKIAEIAGISYTLAKTIQDLLFATFPAIKVFMEQTKWECRSLGFVETFLGRRRRFFLRNAPSGIQAQAERRALNFKVQSQNSDIVMRVLCWIGEIVERDMGGRLLLTVHDSIGFQVPKKYVSQLPDLFAEHGTKRVAKEFPFMPVPYRWDLGVGPNYGDLSSVDKYLANSPIILPVAELDGYSIEDQMEDLRDPDEAFPVTNKGKAKKKMSNVSHC